MNEQVIAEDEENLEDDGEDWGLGENLVQADAVDEQADALGDALAGAQT